MSRLEGDEDYDCNGIAHLSTILHSHKPIHILIIALGGNDLKERFNNTAQDIYENFKTLCTFVQNQVQSRDFFKKFIFACRKVQSVHYIYFIIQTNIGTTPKDPSITYDNILLPPHIVILAPPILYQTPINIEWGVQSDIHIKSKQVIDLLPNIVHDVKNVSYLDLNSGYNESIKVSNIDGAHYELETQPLIANALYDHIISLEQSNRV